VSEQPEEVVVPNPIKALDSVNVRVVESEMA
jgi:hypothetical protein